VEGAKGSGHITTHVERKSRYLIAAKLANKTAIVTAAAVTVAFRPIPRTLRHTLTLDCGREFTRFYDIEKGTGLAVYFADPYSAWQRGYRRKHKWLVAKIFPKRLRL
jgi:transposase, IS30 family